MNSVQESSSKGVPMVCIPVFADQLRNAKMVEYRGIGVTLNKDSLTTEDFTAAIKEVLENDK
jgi:UDP:flavonoid glycosyltransferase YjiC (YdhE family)